MNRQYRKILQRIDAADAPCHFEGHDAALAAELIEAEYAIGSVTRASDGKVKAAAATGLTFEGRCAADEASVWFRVERVYDILIGMVAGAVVSAGAQILIEGAHWIGRLLSKGILNGNP